MAEPTSKTKRWESSCRQCDTVTFDLFCPKCGCLHTTERWSVNVFLTRRLDLLACGRCDNPAEVQERYAEDGDQQFGVSCSRCNVAADPAHTIHAATQQWIRTSRRWEALRRLAQGPE